MAKVWMEGFIKAVIIYLMDGREMIDLHIHGIDGFDTRTRDAADIVRLATLAKDSGVSAILPVIYPSPIEEMRQQMAAVREAMDYRGAGESEILGVYLEGPFLSPLRGGALEADAFLEPSVRALGRLLDGFEEVVRIITIAPELGGALKVMENCAMRGIKVNMGHSDATFAQALEGKRAGASGVTHLFNAMRPFHHREPGLAGLGLLDEDLYVEVIADGVHLSPEALRLIFNAKRAERIIVVSDRVKGPMYRGGVLQGSETGLPEAVGVLKNLGLPESGIALAVSENPRRYFGG
jgi:N-acetylglucosamine-6-phosphate deacetylase